MKWYKHLSGSLNNSIIFETIEKFKGDGYLVFFGTLELMADEFDIYNPGYKKLSMKKMQKSFQLSRQKTRVILEFIHSRSMADISKSNPKLAEFCEKTDSFLKVFREFSQKNFKKMPGFLVRIDGDKVEIICLRLRYLCDEYTQKLIANLSGQNQESVGTDRSSESEVESDLKDLSGRAPIHFEIKFGDFSKEILKVCQTIIELQGPKISFNVFQWVQVQSNMSKHPRAILDALIGLSKYWTRARNKWTYASSIVEKESGNYYETEHQIESEEFNSQWNQTIQNPDVAKLIDLVGNGGKQKESGENNPE